MGLLHQQKGKGTQINPFATYIEALLRQQESKGSQSYPTTYPSAPETPQLPTPRAT